jgi:hypothetical protein
MNLLLNMDLRNMLINLAEANNKNNSLVPPAKAGGNS